MKEFFLKIWKYLLVAIVGIFIGLMINVPSCTKQSGKVIEIPVHDTITVDSVRILDHTVWKYKTDYDTTVVTIYDTDTIKVPVVIPIDHYQYQDTIRTDTTSAELFIAYEGYKAKIDSISLKYNYYNKLVIIPELKKRVSPFIGLQAGPIVNSGFREVNGAAVELNGGVIFRSGWGVLADYELDALTSGVQHTIKAGFIKLF